MDRRPADAAPAIDPYDADRPLRLGCVCGRHGSDATHFLSPMPLAISLGLGSTATPMRVATIRNTNGQAITRAVERQDKRMSRLEVTERIIATKVARGPKWIDDAQAATLAKAFDLTEAEK